MYHVLYSLFYSTILIYVIIYTRLSKLLIKGKGRFNFEESKKYKWMDKNKLNCVIENSTLLL